jgi:hypothetical protein
MNLRFLSWETGSLKKSNFTVASGGINGFSKWTTVRAEAGGEGGTATPRTQYSKLQLLPGMGMNTV